MKKIDPIKDWGDNVANKINELILFVNELNDIVTKLCEGEGIPPEKYPCAECGKLRTKAEGGTVFTVCDKCWEKSHREPTPTEKEARMTIKELDELFDECSIIPNKDILYRDKVITALMKRYGTSKFTPPDYVSHKDEMVTPCPYCGGNSFRVYKYHIESNEHQCFKCQNIFFPCTSTQKLSDTIRAFIRKRLMKMKKLEYYSSYDLALADVEKELCGDK